MTEHRLAQYMRFEQHVRRAEFSSKKAVSRVDLGVSENKEPQNSTPDNKGLQDKVTPNFRQLLFCGLGCRVIPEGLGMFSRSLTGRIPGLRALEI